MACFPRQAVATPSYWPFPLPSVWGGTPDQPPCMLEGEGASHASLFGAAVKLVLQPLLRCAGGLWAGQLLSPAPRVSPSQQRSLSFPAHMEAPPGPEIYQLGLAPELSCQRRMACSVPRGCLVVRRKASMLPVSKPGASGCCNRCGSLRPSAPYRVSITWGRTAGWSGVRARRGEQGGCPCPPPRAGPSPTEGPPPPPGMQSSLLESLPLGRGGGQVRGFGPCSCRASISFLTCAEVAAPRR